MSILKRQFLTLCCVEEGNLQYVSMMANASYMEGKDSPSLKLDGFYDHWQNGICDVEINEERRNGLFCKELCLHEKSRIMIRRDVISNDRSILKKPSILCVILYLYDLMSMENI